MGWKVRIVAISFMLAAAALNTSGPGAQSADVAQAQIRTALETWMAEFNAGDARKICDLFASDLVADYQGQPERDYNALCKLLRGSLRDPNQKFRYSLRIREILVSGGLAVVRLVWTLNVRPKNGSGTHSTIEPGIDIFRLQPDGTWKISRFMAYGTSQ